MQPTFDFDHFRGLAQNDPGGFEAHRHALLEAAIGEMPSQQQDAARAALARVQVAMAAAGTATQRLLVAMSALNRSMAELQQCAATARNDLPTQ